MKDAVPVEVCDWGVGLEIVLELRINRCDSPQSSGWRAGVQAAIVLHRDKTAHLDRYIAPRVHAPRDGAFGA